MKKYIKNMLTRSILMLVGWCVIFALLRFRMYIPIIFLLISIIIFSIILSKAVKEDIEKSEDSIENKQKIVKKGEFD